jgi:capsular exopolysaccharide synthesis family protein
MVENPDRTLHINEYFKVIRNRLWVIFTIFALTVMSGWYVTNQVLQKVYTATAQIQIHPRGVGSIPMFDVMPDRGFDPIDYQAEFQIMQSRDTLLPIIKDLGLDKIWAKRIFKSDDETLPDEAALGYMKGILKVDPEKGTNIMDITAASVIPKEAADIANALADRYKTMRDVEQDQRNNRGADSLTDQITQQQRVVDAKKAAVDKLRDEAGDQGISINPSGSQDRLDTDLDSRKRDLLNAKEDADGRRVLYDSVKDLSDDEFISTLEALQRPEASITSMRSEILTMESSIDNLLKQGFEENHPRVQAMRAELDKRRSQIKDLIAGERRALKLDVDVSNSKVELLTKEVAALDEQARENQKAHLGPYHEALRDYEQQMTLLDTLTLRKKQVLADKQLLESPVRIISRATPPDHPTSPKSGLNMVLSIIAGLLLGVMTAFLIEYLDTSVKTMADAELLLGLPVLTVIPNKGGPMPLTLQAARLPHAEGYRILRAKLDLKVLNGIGPSLSMLSGGPGEGKSTTIYNLAIVCAQSGQSVLLVDCDLRRPTLHELLNVSNDHGLANYLRGEGDAVEYIQQTPLPKLHVLAAGDMPVSDIGALTGDKLRPMLDDLKQRYDLVLLDSPPVLGISDGSIIAREVDYVILVIQHRRYPREISLRAKRAIEEVHGNCVGMVLNCVAVRSDDAYYYYSNYGNYYKKSDKKKSSKNRVKESKKAVLTNGRKPDLESDEF